MSDVKQVIKQAQHIRDKRAAAVDAAASSTTQNTNPSSTIVVDAVGEKVAYVTKDGEPLFTLDQALEVFSKAANLVAEADQTKAAQDAHHDKAVNYVRDLINVARQSGDAK